MGTILLQMTGGYKNKAMKTLIYIDGKPIEEKVAKAAPEMLKVLEWLIEDDMTMGQILTKARKVVEKATK